MPGIDELLRTDGERWRSEVDAHDEPAAAPVPNVRRRSRSTSRRRVWTISVAGVAAAAVVVLAIGLGHDSSNSNSTASAYSPDNTEGNAVAGSVPSLAPRSGKLAPLTPTSAPTNAPASAALILTGSVSLTVAGNADVDRAATRATGIADATGGRVDEDSRTSAGHRSATLVLRVPNPSLASVTAQLASLGRVSSRDLETKDVTSQVADVNSRVTSARAAIAALNRLYRKADSVRDLITVESALAARQSDLEALEAQQRTLTAQTSLATLTLSIDVRTAPPAKHHHRSGFVGGLHRGWHAFTSAAGAVATAAGAVLPFAVLALVIGAGALLAVRRRRTSP